MKLISVITVVVALAAGTNTTFAQQFGFGVTTVNGVPTGGSLQVNGVVLPGGRYVRMGVNTRQSQLIGVGQFSFPAGFGGGGFGGGGNFGGGLGGGLGNGAGNFQASARRVPTIDGFLLAAAKFDQDKDKQFDKEELAAIGVAVWKELQQRTAGSPRKPTKTKDATTEQQMLKEVEKAFVRKSMTFDKDGDETLSKKETRALATVLIKSLLKS